nr:MAG TPA: hypothetical protein [Caudoviricetes sp.]
MTLSSMALSYGSIVVTRLYLWLCLKRHMKLNS